MSNGNLWIAHSSNREQANMNLICFPFPGGSASYFANWSSSIPDSINVCPVLYPMRERRRKEAMPESLIEMAISFVEENMYLFEKPYGIFGYCAGSVMGYEVAKYLQAKKGIEPILMSFASANAPCYAASEAVVKSDDIDENEIFMNYIRENNIFDEKFINNPMFYSYYFPIMKADWMLLSSYRFEPSIKKFRCPIDVSFGSDDGRVSIEQMKEWAILSEGEFSLHEFSGGHFFVNEQYEALCNQISNKMIK